MIKIWKNMSGQYTLPEEADETTLDEVLQTIVNLSGNKEPQTCSSIGLKNAADKSIILTYFGEDTWLIETKGDNTPCRLGEYGVSTERIRQIARAFCSGEEWRECCNLNKNYIELGNRELVIASAEELADKLVAFAKDLDADLDVEGQHEVWCDIIDLFWLSKGYKAAREFSSRHYLAVRQHEPDRELEYKMMKAELLAQLQLKKNRQRIKEKRLQREKNEVLLDLKEDCITWAVEHNLDHLTSDDIEAFLVSQNMESDIYIQTKEHLRVLSNVDLKLREK